jgi:phosphoribosylformylglycinamidine synthase PurS subunit
VATIVVEVMPKAELLDPQGKAIAGALDRLGTSQFTEVRVGKRFEITVEGPVDEALMDHVQQIASTMLSNSVIEDVIAVTVLNDTILTNSTTTTPIMGPQQ